jgi:hypothetical protein
MLNPKVRRELLQKLGGITPQALSQRAKRIKDSYGPMKTEEAVYVIAHMEGIDLSKQLPIATLDRIRALVPRQVPTAPKISSTPVPRVEKKSRRSKVPSYPMVKASLNKVAEDLGAQVYPQLFLLENSIRALIGTRLSRLNSSWWNLHVPSRVQQNVSRTMSREKRFPYREARGNHPLSYANFSDLKEIILANPSEFHDIILDFEWFKVRMDEIYMARNNLAHCVPLSKDDISRISLFFRDWARLLETARIR